MTPTTTDPIALLLEARKRHVLTYREISNAINMTEKAVWSLCTNGSKPRDATKAKILSYVKELDAKASKETEDTLERYEQTILDAVYDGEGGTFWSKPKEGERFSEASYPRGVVRVDRWYQSFIEACNIIGKDDLLLKAFNNLCQSGKLKILNIRIPTQRPLKQGEGFAFLFETGEARRKQAGQDTAFEMTRSYKDEPLDKAEMIPDSIRDPKSIIISIRKSREAGQRAMHGHYDLSKGSELRREELEDESAQRMSNKDLFEILRAGGKQMAEGDFAPSEYDSLPDEKVKTREIYEVKIENKTKAPMIVYNHDGSKVEIQPGESAIQTKMRFIKKMPVVGKESAKK